MEENKRLLKNTFLITFGNFGSKMIAFFLLPLYTSNLSTSQYGIYDFIVAISAFILPIVTFSMHEALFRFAIDNKNNEEKFKSIITNSFCFVIIGITIMGCIVYIIKILFPHVKYMFYIFLYVSSNALFSFFSNLLRGLGEVKVFSIITSIKNIMQILLNVICIIVLKLGISSLLLSYIISEFSFSIVIFFKVKLFKKIKFKYFSIKNSIELLKYSIPLIPNTIGAQIINLSDRLMISIFMGPSANGIYSISYKFPNIIDTVYHFFYMAWSESASIVFNKGLDKAKEYYKKLYFIIDNFIFSAIILIISLMPILFKILIKGNYIEGFYYIWILMFAMYFNCLAKFYSGIFTALKRTKVMAISTIIAAIINFIINIIFIKKYGLYAAAFSTLLSEFILFLIRKYKLSDFLVIKEESRRKLIKMIFIILIVILYDFNNIIKTIISVIFSFILFIFSNINIIKSILKHLKERREKSI